MLLSKVLYKKHECLNFVCEWPKGNGVLNLSSAICTQWAPSESPAHDFFFFFFKSLLRFLAVSFMSRRIHNKKTQKVKLRPEFKNLKDLRARLPPSLCRHDETKMKENAKAFTLGKKATWGHTVSVYDRWLCFNIEQVTARLLIQPQDWNELCIRCTAFHPPLIT